MKRALLILLLLTPFIASAYVSPGKPKGFLNDFANIFSPDTKSQLEADLRNFADTTGNEISVVTINSLESESVETYAEKLFQEWGIGKEDEDNGLLLLIALEERVMRIEVGYGLEPYVTDIESGRIIREILTPAFQMGEFDQGVLSAIERVKEDILNGAEVSESVITKRVNWADFVYPLIFLIMFLVSVLAQSRSWWAGGVLGGVVALVFFSGFLVFALFVMVGLIFDFLVSRAYAKHKILGGTPPWWLGGGRGGFGGGFGGFGGGMSGGGGASGRW